MKTSSKTTLNRILTTAFAALTTGACLMTTSTAALGAEGVIVTGMSLDFGEKFDRSAGGASGIPAFTIDDVCAESGMLGMQLGRMVDHVDGAMAEAGSPLTISNMQMIPGAPSRADVEQDIAVAKREICKNPDIPPSIEPFVITYASCRMAMYTPSSAMVINIPGGGNTAIMLVADHATQEVMQLELTSHMDSLAETVGSGWAEEIEMTPVGEEAEHIGYDIELYEFSFDSGLGLAGLGAADQSDLEAGSIEAIGNLVSVTTTGKAWVARNAPGNDVVRSFYQNLTGAIQANQESMIGGMIKNMVGMLREGMPLLTEQETTSKIMGRTQGRGKSMSIVTNIRLKELPWVSCGEVPIPEGYAVTDMNQQMSEAMGGGGTQSSAEMAQAMQQYNEAMQQMTPEQQQMMEQFGIGDMMTQMGGMNPAAAPQAAGTAGPSLAAGSAGSNMPSSAELQSDNLTQMVQNHLKALGYDTGNTDGELSLETTIAISQFQAEKGVEVTGEVSPQLAGMLSAEVDSQRGN